MKYLQIIQFGVKYALVGPIQTGLVSFNKFM